MASLACAQAPQQPTTEGQARYYIYGAFLTHAVPEIMGEGIALGSELEQRLGLKPGADRGQIYDALMTYTDGKRLAVRKASAEQIARYKPQGKRELRAPVFAVQAGEITLLVEYDMQANAIPFVGQLGAVVQPPVAAERVAPPVPAVAVVAPKPVPPPKAVAPASVTSPQAPVVKPQARVAPPPPPPPAAPRRTGPCEVKPVMSEQDLANCRAVGEAKTIQPGPPIVVKPQAVARTEPAPVLQRSGPCVVKPVMSEEDLANCRNAGEARTIQPGPPIVVKPQARIEPVSQQRSGPCEVKPVMSEEDLANCRNAPGGAARVQPGPPPTATRAAAPQPEPAARRPVTPCVIKPVMTEEDRLACGMR